MTQLGPLPPVDDDLWGLIESFVEGTAAPDQLEHLEARLGSDAAARDFYVNYLDLHAHLRWRMRGAEEGQATPATEVSGRHQRRRFRILFSPRVAAVAAALALGLAVCLWLFHHGSEPEENLEVPVAPAGSVAVLI